MLTRMAEPLLAQAREELRRADGKALQGLAVAGAMVVLWSAPLPDGTWRPGSLDSLRSFSWWAACLLWLVAAVSFGAAAFPRLGAAHTGSVVYFGDVSRLGRDPQQLSAALLKTAEASVDGLLAELAWTSRTAMRKYQLVRVGFAAIALSAVGMLVALL
ncbi:Pycsar system effector family protein [Micromonospora zamorensis]|uniref:Pycsar system effector family protein n=1 Tax=Micromonospora zamorensis TaxID=709883 RepID=UPI00339E076D